MFTTKIRNQIYPPLVSNNSYVEQSASQKHLGLRCFHVSIGYWNQFSTMLPSNNQYKRNLRNLPRAVSLITLKKMVVQETFLLFQDTEKPIIFLISIIQ